MGFSRGPQAHSLFTSNIPSDPPSPNPLHTSWTPPESTLYKNKNSNFSALGLDRDLGVSQGSKNHSLPNSDPPTPFHKSCPPKKNTLNKNSKFLALGLDRDLGFLRGPQVYSHSASDPHPPKKIFIHQCTVQQQKFNFLSLGLDRDLGFLQGSQNHNHPKSDPSQKKTFTHPGPPPKKKHTVHQQKSKSKFLSFGT